MVVTFIATQAMTNGKHKLVGKRLDFYGGRKLAIATKSEKTLPLSNMSNYSEITYIILFADNLAYSCSGENGQ